MIAAGGVVAAAGPRGGFDPILGSCLLYVDADTGITESSGRVTVAADQSGHGNDLTPTSSGSGLGPTRSSFRAGRLAFDPVGEALMRLTLTGGPQAQPFTVMFVGTWPNSSDGNGRVAVYPKNAANTNLAAYQNFNFGPFRVRMAGSTSQVLFDITSPTSGVNVGPQGRAFACVNVFDGAASRVRIWADGDSKRDHTVAGSAGTAAADGWWWSIAAWSKQLAASALYAGALSDPEQDALLAGLCERYAITPL